MSGTRGVGGLPGVCTPGLVCEWTFGEEGDGQRALTPRVYTTGSLCE